MECSLFAQYASVSYSENFTGRNVRLGYSFKSLEVGMKYHFNSPDYTDGRKFAYFRKSYATSLSNRFGVYINKKKKLIGFSDIAFCYAFVNADFNYLARKLTLYNQIGIDSSNNAFYQELSLVSKPYFSLETNLGLGYSAKISSTITAFTELGVGIIYMYSKDKIVPITSSYIEGGNGIDLWAFQARVGLLIKIK